MEGYKNGELDNEIRDAINEYFVGYGYEEQNFGSGHFEKYYNRYLLGAYNNICPTSIDNWIELERVLGMELELKNAMHISSNLYIKYDVNVSDLEYILRNATM